MSTSTETRTGSQTETEWVDKIGQPSFSSIEEMVRALDIKTAAEDYACDLTAQKCVELAASVDTEVYETEPIDDLRDTVASLIADGTLEPDDFEFDEGEARQAIEEDPLSLQLRSGWYSPGEIPEAVEYELLLGTGGPAVRIVGELGVHNEPATARLEVQDWFKPWTEYFGADRDVLLQYASCFYFGDS